MKRLASLLVLNLGLIMPALGEVLFTEDFEGTTVIRNEAYPPDYFFQDGSGAPYRASPSPYPRWLRSNNGFGNTSAGVHTNAGFTGQKLGFRYTNSGYSTDEGVIGDIDLNYAKYTVEFDIVPRVVLSNTGQNYKVEFVAYPDGYDRQNYTSDPDLYFEMDEATGTTTTNRHITLTYTTDPVLDAEASGYDLGIRVYGATSQASFDNVQVTYEPIVPYVKAINKAVVIGGKLFVPSGSTPKIATFWTPAEIGTVAWYDAYTTASFGFSAGTSVSAWYDKSGNESDIEQGSGPNQPTLIESDPLMNDLPAVFTPDNVSHYLQGTNSITMKRAYFVCYQGAGTNTVADNHYAIFASTDADPRLTLRSGDFEVWDNQDAKNFDLNGATYRNGSTVNSAPPNALTSLPMPATLWTTTGASSFTETWRILQNNTASWGGWWGGLSEMIFTDGTEDLTTQQKIEGYLAWKWGIQDSLAAGHPYKHRRP